MMWQKSSLKRINFLKYKDVLSLKLDICIYKYTEKGKSKGTTTVPFECCVQEGVVGL